MQFGMQSRPSEVTKYLLNQLEQVQIKLKSVGFYQHPQHDSTFDQKGPAQHSPQSLEKAFTTIDNFSNNVLSLYKDLQQKQSSHQQVSSKDTVTQNLKMLESLT